jgi:hypothetical protein
MLLLVTDSAPAPCLLCLLLCIWLIKIWRFQRLWRQCTKTMNLSPQVLTSNKYIETINTCSLHTLTSRRTRIGVSYLHFYSEKRYYTFLVIRIVLRCLRIFPQIYRSCKCPISEYVLFQVTLQPQLILFELIFPKNGTERHRILQHSGDEM